MTTDTPRPPIRWRRYNKASAATVSGALMALAGVYLDMTPELTGAIQTIITAALVWAVPNGE